jgi:tetratricopeptide (TPR) repeat protein
LAEIITEARGSQVVDSISRIHQLARAGNYRTAMEEAFYALEFAPTYLPLHTYMGELLIQQNRLQDAIDKFSIVAQSYSMRGEANRAIDLFRRITDLSPMDMDARGRLIDQLVARGQTGEAIDEYLKLADVYYSLADLNMARKTFTQALHLAQSATVDRAWKVKILHRMADIDLQSLDWRQALRVFEQIRTLQPDDEKARMTLIDLNLRLRQESQAIAELDGYIAYLYDNKRTQDAIKFLENIIEDNPKQISIRRRLAELYRQVGRTADAISQLDKAGEISLDAGDRNGAAEVIMAILALNPPNAADYQRLLAQIRNT